MIENEQFSKIVKVLIIGDANVGKTNLLNRYLFSHQKTTTSPTVGVDFQTKLIPLRDKTVKVHFWDTAGMERYRSITLVHYRKTMAALIVFDMTKFSTFENCNFWYEDLKSHADAKVCICLVGNKLDLTLEKPSLRQVTFEQAKKFADQRKIVYVQTSAHSGLNVQKAFYEVIDRAYKQQIEGEQSKGIKIVGQQKEMSKCCG